jgi:FecR protein
MFGKKQDEELDRAVSELQREGVSPETLEQSARSVWQRLATPNAATEQAGEGCSTVRSDLPLLETGKLTQARELIIEDHLRECASCRAHFAGAPDPVATAAAWRIRPSVSDAQIHTARYAWAIVALFVAAAVAWFARDWYVRGPAGSRAEIESVTGRAYAISATTERPLGAGDEIDQGEIIRTAGESHAILAVFDGSRVEMNQRTELSFSATFRNTSIHLDHGDIIVEAPPRRTGHLYVSTPDCTVSDRGTIFSIESGTKGSRVAVIEGTVSVAQGGKESTLREGESVATAQSVSPVPVSQQINWSEDRQRYIALLDEFSNLRHQLEQIPSPQPRYESRILPVVPSDTVLYLTVPNLGGMLAQADTIFHDELERSAVLREWWERTAPPGQEAAIEKMVVNVETASQYLGNEVVLAGGLGRDDGLLLLAPIERPGLADFLRQQVTTSSSGAASGPFMRVVDRQSLAAIPAENQGLLALVRPDMLVVGTHPGAVRRINTLLDQGSSGFLNSDFGKQILGVYNQGAQVLFAAELDRIMAHAQQVRHLNRAGGPVAADRGVLQNLGFGDAKYLIATHDDTAGQTENRAIIDFAAQRTGLASWLAPPSAMGSLDFVSSNASAAVSVVTKEPAKMLDDVLQFAAQDNLANEEMARRESEVGVDFRNNVAGALGREMTFALDGAVLPKPSWKLIVEVNDPGALQQSIAALVGYANLNSSRSGTPALTLDQEQDGSRAFYRLRSTQPGPLSEIDYTFAEGYLVAAPSRALVMNALETRANGNSLAASASFRASLPRDAHANFSAVLYQNLGPVIQPLASQFGPANTTLLEHLASDSKPSAICAYGGTGSIEVASTSNLFDLQPNVFALIKLLSGGNGTSSQSRP